MRTRFGASGFLLALAVASACKQVSYVESEVNSQCSDEYMKVRDLNEGIPREGIPVFSDRSFSNAVGFVGPGIPVIRRLTLEVRNPGTGFPCKSDRRVMEVNVRDGGLANQVVWACAEHLEPRSSCPASANGTASQLLTSQPLLTLGIPEIRIGRVWFDKPLTRFMSASDVSSLKSRLRTASQGGSSDYAFVKCERRNALPDTAAQSECAYLLDRNNGTEFEFFAAAFRSDGERQIPCQLSEPGCTVRQAVRVRSVADGLQRPAYFVARQPPSNLALLRFRPDVALDEVALSLVPGGQQFQIPFGEALARQFGLGEGVRVANLVHFSNTWIESDRTLRLNRARAGVMVVLSAAAGAGAAATLAGGGLSAWGTAMATLDLAASASAVTAGVTEIVNLRGRLETIPPGPARASANAAILVADAAPYLGVASLGAHVLDAAYRVILKTGAFTRYATRHGMRSIDQIPAAKASQIHGTVEGGASAGAGIPPTADDFVEAYMPNSLQDPTPAAIGHPRMAEVLRSVKGRRLLGVARTASTSGDDLVIVAKYKSGIGGTQVADLEFRIGRDATRLRLTPWAGSESLFPSDANQVLAAFKSSGTLPNLSIQSASGGEIILKASSGASMAELEKVASSGFSAHLIW